ncbi:hypothetical protein N7532_010586 [Penicillium argentinense]|uniref:Cysteine dioxygenase n=1 Tax=Penicillium argentinense TaxID=1131581 RepID=A0A9W9JY64_9EURO|nr:uncharacterized protein N7532_010586 [Penicillium argentinense]KAJ5085815.1 hypothetical protein N7532_010586 [Penicillium argentinense]
MPYLRNEIDSPANSELNSNAFEKLVQDLSVALGPSSGLDSDDVDPLAIQKLMEKYVSNESEWGAFALADGSRTYTRNLIDEGNGKSNLVGQACCMGDILKYPATISYHSLCLSDYEAKINRQLILVWSPGKGSAIHDHANAHCVMKILKGNLQETLYSWPDTERIEHGETSPPQITKHTIYGENQVTYMSDKLGLHRISNPDPDNFAISLHLYTPPNAAIHGFSMFDEKTGKASHIKQSHYYSVRGKRLSDA